MHFLALTGMRAPSELFSLTWEILSLESFDNRTLSQPMNVVGRETMERLAIIFFLSLSIRSLKNIWIQVKKSQLSIFQRKQRQEVEKFLVFVLDYFTRYRLLPFYAD